VELAFRYYRIFPLEPQRHDEHNVMRKNKTNGVKWRRLLDMVFRKYHFRMLDRDRFIGNS